MHIELLSNSINAKKLLTELGVDGGGIGIMASKMKHYVLHIKELHVGAANILKQDALSIGADLAVPRGTVIAKEPFVDCILIATQKQLQTLSKKELAQPFGLKELALYLQKILKNSSPKKREIMGVINSNDDSFYNKSRFQGVEALKTIEQMIEDGADIIDIGGVSSRPNAPQVSVQEELLRVSPILGEIKKNKLYEKVKFSIDSYTPEVISLALESGFSIVNDIRGLESDEVCKLCAEYKATAIIMHMQGTPQTMQNNPTYKNLLGEVYQFLEERIQKAQSFGIDDIMIDIGIGFGKSLEDNLSLVKNLEHFLSLQQRVLVGASRKSMIDKLTPCGVDERLAGTLAIHLEALRNGASVIRVHDVKEHFQALKVFEAFDAL